MAKRSHDPLDPHRRRSSEPAARDMSLPAGALIGLQQSAGNQAVTRLVQRTRSVSRTPAGEMAAAADESEQDMRQQRDEPSSLVGTISNIHDVDRARHVRDKIIGYRPQLSDGLAAGSAFVSELQYKDNEHAIELLDEYLNAAAMQGSMLGDFQGQFAELERDHARLMAQVQAYAATPQGAGTNDSVNPKEVGSAQIASTGQTLAQLQADFRLATTAPDGSGNTATHQRTAGTLRLKLQEASQAVSHTRATAVSEEHKAVASNEKLRHVALSQGVAALQANIETLKTNATTAKEQVVAIGSVMKLAAKIGAGAVNPATAAEAGVSVMFDLLSYGASHLYDDAITEIKKALVGDREEAAAAELLAAASEAESAKGDYMKACRSYAHATDNLESAQDEFRAAMQQMGASADAATGGGSRFEVIAQLLAEADAFIAQADATIAIGELEIEQSRGVSEKAAALRTSPDGGTRGIPYWRPSPWKAKGTKSWTAVPESFVLSRGMDLRPGNAEGKVFGANAVMQRAIEDLHYLKVEVVEHAGSLRPVFHAQAPT